ncbi:MAG: hypothetical protein QGH06_08445 [Lutibacter sp.]|nr:hypothetical protein [Lutibacter sp.]
MPKIITIFGEMVFVSMVCLGLAIIVATLINSSVYISFAGAAADNTDQAMGLVAMLSDMAANVPFVDGIPGIDWAGGLANVSGEAAGSWSNFIGDIEGGVMTIINAFMVVIYFYIVREVYNFAMTLITAFINFLPKLAIPLAIRNK